MRGAEKIQREVLDAYAKCFSIDAITAENVVRMLAEWRDKKRRARDDGKARCLDCGVDVTPCTGRRGCRHAGRWEWFMVKHSVWQKAGLLSGYICVGCLESRLGRRLRGRDFIDVAANDPTNPWHTARLASRLLSR